MKSALQIIRFGILFVAVGALAGCASTGTGRTAPDDLDGWMSKELGRRGVIAAPGSPSTTLKGI